VFEKPKIFIYTRRLWAQEQASGLPRLVALQAGDKAGLSNIYTVVK
jgi:hypothetical protein